MPMIPLSQMTQAQIERAARQQEQAGDIEHAAALRAYGRCLIKFGPDPDFWPPSQAVAEGLEYEPGMLLERINRAVEKVAARTRADYRKRGKQFSDDALTLAAFNNPAIQTLVNDPLATEVLARQTIADEIKEVATKMGIKLTGRA